jgi:hypothetical protein
LGISLAVVPRSVTAEPASPSIVVRTIAGSGAAGLEDGARGSFLAPFGVAFGPNGVMYVSDAIGQRIRRVDAAGRITTLAGGGPTVAKGMWVRGDYRDGKGAEARFNRPAGLVWSAGRLYVADTENHCVRVVTPDGTVSTLVGSPANGGAADGPFATAKLDYPTGLAVDHQGTLYVADYFGVRILRNGTVTTIPNFGGGPWSVSVADTPQGVVIFAAGIGGMYRRAADGTIDHYATDENLPEPHRLMQGIEPLGYPASVAAIDENSIVYSDVRENTVRYLNWYSGASEILGGVDVYDGASSSAGWADGAGDVARFDTPMSLAVGPHDEIAVADMGSRRIRLITHLDLSHEQGPPDTLPRPVPRGEYRIAFVGNSAVNTYLRWDDGIPGIVERSLRADPSVIATKLHLVVTPNVFAGTPLEGQAAYVKELIAETHAANVVIFNLNTVALYSVGGLSSRASSEEILEKAPQWTKVVTDSLRSMNEALSRNNIRFFVYTTPLAENVWPAEEAWNRLAAVQTFAEPSISIGDLMNNAVRASGVPYLDGWAVFEQEIRSPNHVALFGTQDSHFSPHGRAVIGNALADYLERQKPWRPRAAR